MRIARVVRIAALLGLALGLAAALRVALPLIYTATLDVARPCPHRLTRSAPIAPLGRRRRSATASDAATALTVALVGLKAESFEDSGGRRCVRVTKLPLID